MRRFLRRAPAQETPPSVGAALPAPWMCWAVTEVLSLGWAGGSLLPRAGRGSLREESLLCLELLPRVKGLEVG